MSLLPKSIPANKTKSSLKERFEESAQKHAERLALVTPDVRLTYQQLNESANSLAYKLLGCCSAAPQTIGILQGDLAHSIISLLAVFKSGKTAVLLDPESPILYSKEIAGDAELSWLISHDNLKEEAIQLVDENHLITFNSLDGVHSLANPELELSPNSIARILYTSGSTGKPRGCFHDQRFFLHSAEIFRQSQQLTCQDRQLLVSPIQHMSGTNILNRTLLVGATLYAYPVRQKGVAELLNWIHENQISLLQLVPTLFRRLTMNPDSYEQLKSVRLLHLGGEAVTLDDLKIFRRLFSPDCHFMQNLGSTELSSYRQFYLRPQEELPIKSVPAGVPVPDKNILIRREDGADASAQESGEVIVRTRFMVRGFTQDATSISEALRTFQSIESEETNYATGDIGHIDEDGVLFHEGRKGQQIKIQGNRVELAQLESELRRHPDVAEAVAKIYQQPEKPPIIISYYTSSKVGDDFSANLRVWLIKRLPIYMIPMACVRLDSLPQLSSGKVDLKSLSMPAPLQNNREPNEIEWELIQIWEELFKKQNLTLNDDFLMLGGDSILAVELACMIEERMGFQLTPEMLVHARNIQELATHLGESKISSEWNSLLPLSMGEQKPPLFFVHGWSGRILNYLRIAAHFKDERNSWGIQALEIATDTPRQKSFEEMAESYIEELIQVQPTGPYYFVGFSLGGLVAYEIARQMQNRGLAIGRLVVIDSTLHNLPPSLHAKAVLPMHIERAKNYIKRRFSDPEASFKRDMKAVKRVFRIFKKVSQSQSKPVDEKPSDDLLDYYSRIGRQYVPQRTTLPLTVIQSNQTEHHFKNSWSDLVGGNAEILRLNYKHMELIREPAASEIAEIIRQRL